MLRPLMVFGEFKSPAGLIRVELEVQGGKISSVKFTGDFFVYPEEHLSEMEKSLKGEELDVGKITERIRKFYSSRDVETPLLEPRHWGRAIAAAWRDYNEQI